MSMPFEVYQVLCREQNKKLNEKYKNYSKERFKEQKILEKRVRQIYLGLNNVVGDREVLMGYIVFLYSTYIKKEEIEFSQQNVKQIMRQCFMLNVEYNEELCKLIVSQRYDVYINLNTMEMSASDFELIPQGKGYFEQMFNIVMVDYNKVDDSLTWLDFIK